VKREISREEYSVRLKWLIWSRVVLTTFLVGTLIFFQQRYKVYSFHIAVLYYVLFSAYVLAIIYRYVLRTFQNLPFLGYLQTSIDILLVTFLVYLTGGIDSGFSVLYHLTIISASIILSRRGGYLAASFASILYGTMLDMQYYNALFFIRSQNFTAVQVLYQVFINILSFYIVALLSGYLTERLRKTRDELREKSKVFDDLRVLQEHILKSVGSGILTMDLSGNITSWNPAAEQISGYSYDEIKNTWQDVFGNSFRELFGHTESLKERPFRFDGQLIKKDGNIAILGMTASLLKDDTNVVRGIILTFQDITKIVEMEDQIRRQERLATVGSLAAGIAHEIRNPLAALSGSIQVLQGELNLKDDNKRLMDIVLHETDRLNAIITEFLEYARPTSSQADNIEFLSLLDETITLLRNSKNFHERIIVQREIDPHIVLKGDPQRLRQVFWNLLINACQAMPDGGILTIMAVPFSQAEEDASWCQITISDTGHGITDKDRGKIFDPFFTTKAGGTGLGLAIAYRIVDDHQGGITVESEPGKGTQFKIRLPMIEDAVHQPPVTVQDYKG
jgi:two-component system sensor histidine kinase PilS (NtrC family)